MPETEKTRAAIERQGKLLSCHGEWTVGNIAPLLKEMQGMAAPQQGDVQVDGSAIGALDTAGAWLLLKLQRDLSSAGKPAVISGLRDEHAQLLDYIAAELAAAAEQPVTRSRPDWLARWARHQDNLVGFLAFIGETVLALLRALRHPGTIRWQELLEDAYQSGVKALPIVGLLSFLMGVVIAYQGAVQLRLYGANIYVADLVGYSMLRELAPLLTAILICGRTGSAYAARIGTMKVREEVDALRTLGVPPVDLLVLPRLLALFIAMPLVTVFSDILSVLGGMTMSSLQLGIGYKAFIGRLEEAIEMSTFMIGVGKAPVFAMVIAIVGCYQGFKVEGSAESVGRHTTVSVVQSIFLVIVIDAMFSILFSVLGV